MAVAEFAEFSLNDLAAEILATTDVTETAAMAAEIAALVPVEHLRSALYQALIPWVRNRNTHKTERLRRIAKDAEGTAGHQPASRIASLSGVYMRWMQSFIGIPGGGQKRRADVTLDEQRAVADYRKSQAASFLTEAQREHMFVTAMEKAGAATLGDLPEVAVIEILRWEPKK
jgi:hypothetical protein